MSIFDKINAIYSAASNVKQQQNAQLGAQVNCNSSNSSNYQDLLDQIQQSISQSQQIGVVGTPQVPFYPPFTTTGIHFPNPLSSEEEKELSDLAKQRELNIAGSKLDRFKSLPKEYRQTIINLLMWDEVVDDINNHKGEVTDRERELQSRKDTASGFSRSFYPQTVHIGDGTFSDRLRLPTAPRLPEGISINDLIQAHMDASLEEELQDGEESK